MAIDTSLSHPFADSISKSFNSFSSSSFSGYDCDSLTPFFPFALSFHAPANQAPAGALQNSLAIDLVA